MSENREALQDGELQTPANYRKWPVFLLDVEREDVKQVRDIYINEVGASAEQGEEFPDGSVSVMELYSAKLDANGEPERSRDGKMIRGELTKIYLMAKQDGADEHVAPALRNNDWVYAGFLADGTTPINDGYEGCRSCHLPLARKFDFVHRYDEYFESRNDSLNARASTDAP